MHILYHHTWRHPLVISKKCILDTSTTTSSLKTLPTTRSQNFWEQPALSAFKHLPPSRFTGTKAQAEPDVVFPVRVCSRYDSRSARFRRWHLHMVFLDTRFSACRRGGPRCRFARADYSRGCSIVARTSKRGWLETGSTFLSIREYKIYRKVYHVRYTKEGVQRLVPSPFFLPRASPAC